MKQHTKATRTTGGTQISVDEMEEMAFEEHGLMEVDKAAQVYRYTDNGGVHYVAPMRDAKADQDAAFATYEVTA